MMAISDNLHGSFRAATIENDILSVTVVPGYGAKVIDLTDKRTGRNWLVAGTPTEAAADDAVFGGDEAYGWDECFPTVAPCEGHEPGWATRDHGLLWGRPWQFLSDYNSITTTFDHQEFAFSRHLSLADNRLTVGYTLESRSSGELPYLWSAHPLLDLSPGETIALAGTSEVSATYVSAGGRMIEPGTFAWPLAAIDDQILALDQVHPTSERFAAKLYCDGDVPNRVIAGGSAGSLTLTWQQDEITSLGIWLDYGGWPEPGPVHQVAFEPTTAPADDLRQALSNGRERVLAAGETQHWWIEMAFDTAFSGEASGAETRQ